MAQFPHILSSQRVTSISLHLTRSPRPSSTLSPAYAYWLRSEYDTMDKMPVEILRKIFLSSLPDRHAIAFYSPLSDSVSSPLYISHVCRHWREVSLSYGTLWSYLSLYFKDGFTKMGQEAVVTVFNTWLERTNGCALNFAFWCSLCGDLSRKTASVIIQTLVSERSRWRDVYFSWKFSDPDFPIDLDGMPTLTSLYLRPNFFTRVNLAKSPLLKTLELDGISVLELGEGSTFVSLERCSLRFEKVNGLQETKRAAQACLDVFKAAVNMTEFSYYLTGFDNLEPLGDGEYSCTARNIKSITLDSLTSAAFVLNKLTLPSLQCLRYYANYRDSLLRFVQHSFPPLLALELSGACTDEATLVPALRLLPELQELSLISPHISPWFFRELTRDVEASESTDDEPICPKLGSFHLDAFNQGEEWRDALCDMVETRCENLKTFKRAWIHAVRAGIKIQDLRNILEAIDREVWIDGDVEDPLLDLGRKISLSKDDNDDY